LNDQKNVTGEQFAAILRDPLQLIVTGILMRHNTVPAPILIATLSAAFGQVLSEATATPDVKMTLHLRKQAESAFVEMLRKHVPALQQVSSIGLAS